MRLLDGSIQIPNTVGMQDGNLRSSIIQFRAELLINIGKYVSGTLRGEDLAAVEQRIFSDVASMRMIGIIEEKTVNIRNNDKNLNSWR